MGAILHQKHPFITLEGRNNDIGGSEIEHHNMWGVSVLTSRRVTQKTATQLEGVDSNGFIPLRVESKGLPIEYK